ncbi:hypothetical protein WN51_10903 [Melipona quadrifasciata]|uniref:Uncharacterized protein n=1 Tax=Melipona quadrifasciata TaxID=166423 RepID=A0A0M9A4W8_9HYME|nr:hypothetical protein WN51_10903 [Melipona quadrifasciata]
MEARCTLLKLKEGRGSSLYGPLRTRVGISIGTSGSCAAHKNSKRSFRIHRDTPDSGSAIRNPSSKFIHREYSKILLGRTLGRSGEDLLPGCANAAKLLMESRQSIVEPPLPGTVVSSVGNHCEIILKFQLGFAGMGVKSGLFRCNVNATKISDWLIWITQETNHQILVNIRTVLRTRLRDLDKPSFPNLMEASDLTQTKVSHFPQQIKFSAKDHAKADLIYNALAFQRKFYVTTLANINCLRGVSVAPQLI